MTTQTLYNAQNFASGLMSDFSLFSIVIASLTKLEASLSTINSSSKIYLDLEGIEISRNGRLSIITAFIYPRESTSLKDVQNLWNNALTALSFNGMTLRAILEEPSIHQFARDMHYGADALLSSGSLSRALEDIQ